MKKLILPILLFFTFNAYAEDITINETKIIFATTLEAKRIISKNDRFISNMSMFDRSSRMKINKPINHSEFIEFLKDNVLEWENTEKAKITFILEKIKNKLQSLKDVLPDQIFIIKTTGAEEGNAVYCRENSIILPKRVINKSAGELENDLIHELFHIISKNNLALRNDLYKIIGYYEGDNFEYPKQLVKRKITNPDGYENRYYLDIQINNQTLTLIPLLISKIKIKEINSRNDFFAYLEFKLAIVKINNATVDDLKFLDESAFQYYFKKIGFNTQYIIHPDEILADNFVLLVNKSKHIKSHWIIEEIRKILFN